MKTFQIGELTIVGPCDHEACKNSSSGTTVQIQGPDDDVVSIPIQDIDVLVLALGRAAGKLS